MASVIGAKLQLDGEAQFKRAVKDIDTNLRTLSSSLELASVKFEGQEKSVEGLTARQHALQRVYDQQVEKVEQIRAALANATEKFGESSQAALAWEDKLNRAEIALEKTRKGLDSTNAELAKFSNAADKAEKETDDLDESLDGTSEKSAGLGDIISNLSDKFGISLPSGIGNAISGLSGVGVAVNVVLAASAALATAIVKVEKKLIDLTKASASYADEILTISTVTGIATDTLQEYTYAAELLDVSVDTLTSSQTKLIRSMADAQSGTATQVDAFNKLGVSYQNADGTLRNTQDVFADVIDALGNMTNETERDAIAMDLMGKSAQDLNPLIKAGSGRMTELAEEAHKVGYVLDDEALDALGRVDDAMQRFNRTTEAAKNKLAVEFAPSMTEAMETLTGLVQDLGTALADSGVVSAFGSILESAVGLLSPLGEAEDRAGTLTDALKPLAMLLAGIADTMTVIAGLAHLLHGLFGFGGISEISGGWDMMKTGLGLNTSSGKLSAMGKVEYADALKSSGYDESAGAWTSNSYSEYEASGFNGSYELWLQQRRRNAAGTDNWRGGMTWVGENGPELAILPRGSKILNAQESRDFAGGDTFYITIDAKFVREFNDVVKIAQNARMNLRKERG